MKAMMRRRMLLLATLAASVVLGDAVAVAQKEVVVHAEKAFPESLTSTSDGTLYVGSIGRNMVLRAMPGAASAEPWLMLEKPGGVTGVLADEAKHTLWVCHNGTMGPTGPTGLPIFESYSLPGGKLTGSYPFVGAPSGLCNDMVIAPDGSMYVTDSAGGRILKLAKGAKELTVWSADPKLTGADGIAFDGGDMYVTAVSTSLLLRVKVKADGSIGEIRQIETDRPIQRPDALRAAGNGEFWLIEGVGRFDHVVVSGDKAQVHVIKEGMDGPTSVTLVGGTAWVLEGKLHYMRGPDAAKDPGTFKVYGVSVK